MEPDSRPLEELVFAGHLPEGEREHVATEVRRLLSQCGVSIANDIVLLGCTGLASCGLAEEEMTFVRENMAGSGIGLPCYVDLKHFCRVHNTIGGLQEGQAVQHADFVDAVSRELTDEEKGHVELVESARRSKGRLAGAKDILEGRVPTRGPETEDEPDGDEEGFVPLKPFECPEHGLIAWHCRFCIAQAIVEGALVPTLLIGVTDDGNSIPADNVSSIVPEAVNEKIQKYEEDGATTVALFARVAVWRRKLTRE